MENLYAQHKSYEQRIKETNTVERILILQKLKFEIINNRKDITEAIYKDFKKPVFESELTEVLTSLDEINFACKNLKNWMSYKKVSSPLTLFSSSSYVHYEALGTVLIMAPWNYPFSLVIQPLVSAVAAGNCVMIKPSEKTSHTAIVIKKIIEAVFDPKHVSVTLGNSSVANKLLDLKFDHIFFTGSSAVGKIVMEKASKYLTPVTLELGGKSPVIIGGDVDLDDCVRKLAWGKFINAGQTCVAPDYVFIDEGVRKEFVSKFEAEIKRIFGTSVSLQKNSSDYARIIDAKSFKRLKGLIAQSDIEKIRDLDESQLFIPPMLLDESQTSDAIMQEEIFGPILPIIGYTDINEVLGYIRSNEKPLALYVFSKNNNFVKEIINQTSSGGVGINHVVLHLANPNLPFGGVGHSGMGSYHGYYGFRAFSHERAIFRQGPVLLSRLFFQPYGRRLSNVLFKVLNFFK